MCPIVFLRNVVILTVHLCLHFRTSSESNYVKKKFRKKNCGRFEWHRGTKRSDTLSNDTRRNSLFLTLAITVCHNECHLFLLLHWGQSSKTKNYLELYLLTHEC